MLKQKRTHADPARTKAAALIAEASRGQAKPDPTPEALAALAELIKYNDTAAFKSRVSGIKAREMLAELGWVGAEAALDSLCKRKFGRRSYATP